MKLSDQDLLLRLRDPEDAFVERKTSGDSKDWLKTVVAFANSAPIGFPAVLFIGARNNGEPEEKSVDLDSLQKTLGGKLAEAYPPIYYLPRVLQVQRKQVLAVIVPGSEDRPHFAGQAYVRAGSETKRASEREFGRLIAHRSSKAYEISRWLGKEITVVYYSYGLGGIKNPWGKPRILEACTQHHVTLREDTGNRAYPLSRVELSFDHERDCLLLEIHPA